MCKIIVENRKKFDLVEAKLETFTKAIVERIETIELTYSTYQILLAKKYDDVPIIVVPKETTEIFRGEDGLIIECSDMRICQPLDKDKKFKISFQSWEKIK